MSARILGLDWFEVVVQGIVTISLGVLADTLLPGRESDIAIAGVIAGSFLVLAWRRRRALPAPEGLPPISLTDLEARVGELDELRQRVYDLEERLDFTERVLAQAREVPRLGTAERE